MHLKCFEKYLKIKLTKKLKISDETIKWVKSTILRPKLYQDLHHFHFFFAVFLKASQVPLVMELPGDLISQGTRKKELAEV